jgi:hypothetical protein
MMQIYLPWLGESMIEWYHKEPSQGMGKLIKLDN